MEYHADMMLLHLVIGGKGLNCMLMITRSKYAMCYSFAISLINGIDMWPEVEAPELLPPNYKNGPGRLWIREFDENGARMRRQGVAYRCTKCDKFGHNQRRCKSVVQNPEAAKRKVH
jgi:hypothetical protein